VGGGVNRGALMQATSAQALKCERTRSLDSASFFIKADCAACSCARVTLQKQQRAHALRNLDFLARFALRHSLL
jgi:hypothetical protein